MTQVFKINPRTSNLTTIFNSLIAKFSHSDTDITVIAKSKPTYPEQSQQALTQPQPHLHSQQQEQPPFQYLDDPQSRKVIRGSQKKLSEGQDKGKHSKHEIPSRKKIDEGVPRNESQKSVEMEKMSQQGLKKMKPRTMPEKKNDKSDSYTEFMDYVEMLPPERSICSESRGVGVSGLKKQLSQSEKSKSKQNQALPVPTINLNQPLTNEILTKESFIPKQEGLLGFSSRSQVTHTMRSSAESQCESQALSPIKIQDELNTNALSYIEKNQLLQLEQYLYNFKPFFNGVNTRIQIKWRLLMAYCKEHNKQYERAAILYHQVLQLAKLSPKSLLVNPADINHRLALCYQEIRRWNDGVVCFSNALKEYKACNNIEKYAECINNLGTLYLTAFQIEAAEQCFLISYELKKNDIERAPQKLVVCLFNLFQCNIANHNYEQAEVVLAQVVSIIRDLKDSDLINAGLFRRRGKLAFMKGNLEHAKQNFEKAKQILQKKYPFSLEYGQICSNLGILNKEIGKEGQAKYLLQMGLTLRTYYEPKDSKPISNIKKYLDNIVKSKTMDLNHDEDDIVQKL